MDGIDSGNSEDIRSNLNHNFDLAKRTYVLGSKKEVVCEGEDSNGVSFTDTLQKAGLSEVEEKALARQTAGFFQSQFGVNFQKFSFDDFSAASFTAAEPLDLQAKEEASLLDGLVTCDGPTCKSSGKFLLHNSNKVNLIF